MKKAVGDRTHKWQLCMPCVTETLNAIQILQCPLTIASCLNFAVLSYSSKPNRQRFNFIYNGSERMRRREPSERVLPHQMRLAKGSFLMAATWRFVDFVINNDKMDEFNDWMKTIWIPDESYFTTLIYNPHLGAPGSYKGK